LGAAQAWKSVAFVCIHRQIISFPAFNLAIPTSARFQGDKSAVRDIFRSGNAYS
jgi:hypothetical protein